MPSEIEHQFQNMFFLYVIFQILVMHFYFKMSTESKVTLIQAL